MFHLHLTWKAFVALMLIFTILWRLGGWGYGSPINPKNEGWGEYRDVLIPIIACLVTIPTNIWVGLAVFVTCNIMRMDDGNWSPNDDDTPSFFGKITHDTTGVWTKGLHGLVTGLVAPLPLYFIGMNPLAHLAFAVGFGVTKAVLRAIANKLSGKTIVIPFTKYVFQWVWVEESLCGTYFSLMLLL